MYYEEQDLPELHYMKHRHDDDKEYVAYENKILDKNKDDFLCQYFFYMFKKTNPCMLISNDQYRDAESYIKLFNFDLWIKVVSYNRMSNSLDKTVLKINPCDFIRTDLNNKRCAIPKKNLNRILD